MTNITSAFLDQRPNNYPFPLCYVGENNCKHLNVPVYDSLLQRILLPANTSSHFGYRIAEEIIVPRCPSSLGKLVYNNNNNTFQCECTTRGLFDGPHCNHPTAKLTRQNGCKKVGWTHDPMRVHDITLFNPAAEGVCVECASASAVPILADEPMCKILHPSPPPPKKKTKPPPPPPCRYDPVSGSQSPHNYFAAGYGCVCDYQNGFVEAYVPGLPAATAEVISNACIKIGADDPTTPHRTDIAFHTLKNGGKPLQTHVYRRLTPAFQFLFHPDEERVLLIDQPALAVAHPRDWLNRHVPDKTTRIRRLRENDTWPVVDKYRLVNYYKRRAETHPIDVLTLMIGLGYETKHWYELTNQRYMSNAVWGHPILIGLGQAYDDVATLNPLGIETRQYWGITMLTTAGGGGGPIRLDTRGGGGSDGPWPVLIPPRYDRDMLRDDLAEMYKDGPDLFFLYATYQIS